VGENPFLRQGDQERRKATLDDMRSEHADDGPASLAGQDDSMGDAFHILALKRRTEILGPDQILAHDQISSLA